MSDSYYFERHGRRVALWTGVGAGLGFVAVGTLRGDWGLAAVGLALPLPFLALYRVMGDPSGVAIAKGQLRWWQGTRKGSVALADILRASDASGCTIRLRDGRDLTLPENALPPSGALLDHLARHGVATERSG
jgi:hypothetical protein